MNDILKTAAQHWAIQRTADRTRWWTHPVIVRHINRIVCGEDIDELHGGFTELLRRMMPPGGFRRALSIGCGSGGKEMRLLRAGIVQRFDLFEIGDHRREQIEKKAADFDVGDRVTIHIGDAFDNDIQSEFDLVHWNNSLHHMLDTSQAIQWSARALRPGGVFAMDDFVGPSRFQWPDEDIELASEILDSLPDRLLAHPRKAGAQLPRRLQRPSIDHMIASDPTEAADSDRILASIESAFPGAEVMLTGGVVYHLVLNDVLANFDDEADGPLLQSLLLLDRELAKAGRTHYAVALGRRPA